MPPLDEKQKMRVQGILDSLNDLLDKRFEQARRINPIIAGVERDVRLHMEESLRQVLSGSKGFGPVKLVVGDIFASADETKKRELMSPTDQVSLMNEIVSNTDEAQKQRNAGQLEIRDIKSLYKALNPSLERIVELMQTWIWWDLRDASDIYRFGRQQERVRELKAKAPDGALLDYYRQEMGVGAGVELDRKQIVIFELQRTAEIIDLFERRRSTDEGYQAIIHGTERDDSPEADALAVRLAKRLKTIDTARQQSDPLDEQVRQFYSPKLNVAIDQVNAQAVLDYERLQARIERQQLAEALFMVPTTGETGTYKQVKLHEMKEQFGALCKSLGTTPEAVLQAAGLGGGHPHAADEEEAKPEEAEKSEPEEEEAAPF